MMTGSRHCGAVPVAVDEAPDRLQLLDLPAPRDALGLLPVRPVPACGICR